MNGEKIKTRVIREISPEWDRLMQLGIRIGRGRAVVYFNEGRPVQVDFAVKKIKLDVKEDFKEKLETIPL